MLTVVATKRRYLTEFITVCEQVCKCLSIMSEVYIFFNKLWFNGTLKSCLLYRVHLVCYTYNVYAGPFAILYLGSVKCILWYVMSAITVIYIYEIYMKVHVGQGSNFNWINFAKSYGAKNQILARKIFMEPKHIKNSWIRKF